MTPTLELKTRVIQQVEQWGMCARFAMLLVSYEDPAKRMEAFYWDSDHIRAMRIEKLKDAFNLKEYEALSLSRIFEASRPLSKRSATRYVPKPLKKQPETATTTQDVWGKDRRGVG